MVKTTVEVVGHYLPLFWPALCQHFHCGPLLQAEFWPALRHMRSEAFFERISALLNEKLQGNLCRRNTTIQISAKQTGDNIL